MTKIILHFCTPPMLSLMVCCFQNSLNFGCSFKTELGPHFSSFSTSNGLISVNPGPQQLWCASSCSNRVDKLLPDLELPHCTSETSVRFLKCCVATLKLSILPHDGDSPCSQLQPGVEPDHAGHVLLAQQARHSPRGSKDTLFCLYPHLGSCLS